MISLSRRRLLSATAVAGSALMFRHALAHNVSKDDLSGHLDALERAYGGRLGVSFLDIESGRRLDHRGDERFPMCSTFKWIAAALVLSRVDRGEEQLDRRIPVSKSDLVAYSPAAEKNVGGDGMSMAELCHAAVTLSDNAAANLILANVGGPSGLTRFVRNVGDTITRLDRIEPQLNEGEPGDPRDTTSPVAMLDTLRKLVLGDALSIKSRGQLTAWLVANTTGGKRLRAGLPANWRIGDKTGSSSAGITNDVAIAWPSRGGPLLVAAYYAESAGDDSARNAVIAEVGRIAATFFVNSTSS